MNGIGMFGERGEGEEKAWCTGTNRMCRNAHYSLNMKIFSFTVVPGCNSTNTADRRLFAAKRVFIYMHIVSCVYFINVHKECSRRSYAVVLCFVHNKCGKYSSVRSHIVMCMDSTFIDPRGRDRGKKPSTKSVLSSSAAISQ